MSDDVKINRAPESSHEFQLLVEHLSAGLKNCATEETRRDYFVREVVSIDPEVWRAHRCGDTLSAPWWSEFTALVIDFIDDIPAETRAARALGDDYTCEHENVKFLDANVIGDRQVGIAVSCPDCGLVGEDVMELHEALLQGHINLTWRKP